MNEHTERGKNHEKGGQERKGFLVLLNNTYWVVAKNHRSPKRNMETKKGPNILGSLSNPLNTQLFLSPQKSYNIAHSGKP